MPPLRVLMLSWEYPPHVVGGLGQHVVDLVPALAEAGVEVHVVTPVRDSRESGTAFGAFHVHRVAVPVTSGDILEEAQAVNRVLDGACGAIIDRFGPMDAIHAHDWLVADAAVRSKLRHHVPLIATIHATEYGRSQGRLDSALSQAINAEEWRLVNEAWQVIVCSNFMATELVRNLGAAPDRLQVVPNGVNTARFDALKGEDHSELRARFALPGERIIFNVGRIVREKGLHVLVEAMPKVLSSVPMAKLVVAGKPDPWGYLDWNRQRAAALGLGEKVYFAGFLSDHDRDVLLTLADAAVFPSLYEPFGIVAPEAMAAGAPVVVSSAGGLAEVVTHLVTGLTSYPDDSGSLAWAIIETLSDPTSAAARARSARARVVRDYNWAKIAAATQEIYSLVVTQGAESMQQASPSVPVAL